LSSREQRSIELNPIFDDLYLEIESGGVDYSYNIGGRWSGKTYGILQIMILICLKYPGYKWAIFRKVYASIKGTVFEELRGILDEMDIRYLWEDRVSPLHIYLTNGSEFIFKGMDSKEKNKGLARVHGFFMEELNEFDSMDFETIDNGIRGKEFPHYGFMAHNPVPKLPGSLYWFQKMFGSNQTQGMLTKKEIPGLGKVLVSQTTFLNNAFCPEKRKQRLIGYKETNPDLYKLWALGEYTELKGAAFKNWDIIHELPEGLDDPGYGLDFGFSNDPAACVRVWVTSSDIYIQGLIYSTGLTNVELYDTMISKGIDQYDEVIADSAEPKSIQDLYDRGLLNISGVHKKPNYKVEMVNIMQAYKIHLLDGDIDLQREFQTYSWQQDKAGNQIPKLQDGNDHYIDAVIMYCHEKLGGISSVVY
jgi:phage terminase large subunit